MAEALKVNKALTDVSVQSNEIGALHCPFEIGEALSVNQTLTSFNLAKNDIGSAGSAAISEGLKKNETLTSLNMRSNDIGSTGWCAIFASLRDNGQSKIASWNLSNEGIDAKAARALAEYVRVNDALTSLDLRNKCVSLGLALSRVCADPACVCTAAVLSTTRRRRRYARQASEALRSGPRSPSSSEAHAHTMRVCGGLSCPCILMREVPEVCLTFTVDHYH